MAKATDQLYMAFDKIDEKGLKPLAKQFGKKGCPVAEIEATNKGKRESGFLIKNFTFTFEDGQKLLCRVKGDGSGHSSIFQVKLNNKVMPIRNVDNVDKAVDELIAYVAKNAKAYEKAKIAREKRKIKVKPPTILTTRKEKIRMAKEELAQITQSNTDLEAQKAEIENSIGSKSGELQKAKSDLEREKARTVELQAEITKLEEELRG